MVWLLKIRNPNNSCEKFPNSLFFAEKFPFTAKNSLFHCVQSVNKLNSLRQNSLGEKIGSGGRIFAKFPVRWEFASGEPVRSWVPRGTLKRFHPDVTEVVDINYVPDQMRIFDTISLIDVSAGLLSPTLRVLRDIGFIEAAKKGHLTLVLFHMLGPSIASLDEITETADYLGDAKYLMVKNFINDTHFFEWDEATYASYFKRVPEAIEIKIPRLVEMATEQVELASVPFATFIANKKKSGDPASYSFVLRGYVRHWLGNVWREYDRIGLIDIVGAKEVPGHPPDGRLRA